MTTAIEPTMGDPTLDLIRAFDTPEVWGNIKDNVPIFRAHKWWVRKVNDTIEEKTTLPGQPDLQREEGWTLKYEVKEEDLDTVCKEVNRTLQQDAKPIKLMIGHRRMGMPQELQPEIAGFGRGAVLGTFGHENIPAVMTRAYYKKGFENAAADYPERSPEYRHAMKDITAVALLKTEPRLPMGMTGYGAVTIDEDVSFYGVGFMADVSAEKGETKEADAPPPAAPAPVAPPPAAPASAPPPSNALAPLGPEEANQAARFMNHWKAIDPVMKYMGEQFAKYQASTSAMTPASPTNGKTPADPIGKENPEGEDQMASTVEITQYEERVAAQEKRLAAQEKQMADVLAENASMYATEQIGILRKKHSKKIPNVEKLREKFVKAKLSGSPDACKELFEDVVQNYATEPQAPVSRGFAPVVDHNQPDVPTDGTPQSVELSPEDVADVEHYAASEKIDMTVDGGWDKAFQGYMQKKKATAA